MIDQRFGLCRLLSLVAQATLIDRFRDALKDDEEAYVALTTVADGRNTHIWSADPQGHILMGGKLFIP